MDIEQIRADTPATDRINHLNNCGSSLPPEQVLNTEDELQQLVDSVHGLITRHGQ